MSDLAEASRARLMQEIDDLRARLAAAEAERDAYRKAAPLCDKHQPDGGARSGCLACGLIRLSAALSNIDYLCGGPNEANVSAYDMDADEARVVEHVRSRLAKRDAVRAGLREKVEALLTYEYDNSDGFTTMKPYKDGQWLRRSDVLAALLASGDAAGGEEKRT